MLRHELRRQSGRGVRHFIDGEADGKQGPSTLGFGVGFVLLHHRHDHVTLVARSPRYAYVELRVHGRRLRIPGPAARVVPATPSPPGQHGAPRLLRVQRRLGHPVVGAHVDDVQLREVPGEVFERHPVNRGRLMVTRVAH